VTHALEEAEVAPTLVDLVRANGYATDKSNAYLEAYEELFETLRDEDVRILELGVYEGGSLLLWRDYFSRGIVVGLDLHLPSLAVDAERIKMFQGNQDDAQLLRRIRADVAPGGFDIVIDDCSHMGAIAARSYRHLFHEHLKPGGIYAIEDWGTGFWPAWPDGAAYRPGRDGRLTRLRMRLPYHVRRAADRALGPVPLASHQAGMVGFVKQLVDECGRPDFERVSAVAPRGGASSIERLIVRTGLAVAVKAAP
jgi:SAM-dependent methyltransferase